ncbi:MAG: B12-binding domain/radical SAM domain protein [Actinobacteria bacterium RBG_19FT_COMBO_54_7]|nr:MAG: B12-binding domain/radical SAM domain protein [Actinobacteria bacterium RBG_19FT_COMBO_54_7]
MFFKKPDIVLLHAPSVYDFRRLTTVPSPLSDLIPSTPAFEIYPIGFTFLGEYLERNHINTRIVNLAQRMIEDPKFDVPRFLSELEPIAFGIDFHWLTHAQGALEIARLLKEIHPSIPVIFGGYSATYFHRELMEYPQVDYVLRGDSTEEPLRMLVEAIGLKGFLGDIPNLTFRDSSGQVMENSLTYIPASLEYLGNNYKYMISSALKYGDWKSLYAFWNWHEYPITMVPTCRGCSSDCAFCGGSKSAVADYCGREQIAFRPPEKIAYDIELLSHFSSAPIFIVGDLLQAGRDYAMETLELISHLDPKNHIIFELFAPAPREYYERIASDLDHFDFQISPETHDEEIRAFINKPYSNEELEHNIAWALEAGAERFDIFFMIGLPGQTRDSIMETVNYCGELLRNFGPRLNPSIGPLAPFIDPGSAYYRRPERYGYHLIHRTLDDYVRASYSPHWRDMLGYETRWLSRQDIVDVTYEALLALNTIKAKNGLVSPEHAALNDRRLKDTISLLKMVDDIMNITDSKLRLTELEKVHQESQQLAQQLYLPKEELMWPLTGARFKRINILRILMGWI